MDFFTLVAAHYLYRHWYGERAPLRRLPAESAAPMIGRLVVALLVLAVGLALLGAAGHA